MSSKSHTKELKDLSKRVGEVLYYLWDPIGVSDVPSVRDEYDDYVPQVVSLIIKKSTPQEISLYLENIATKTMGMDQNKHKDLKIAEVLVNWGEIFGFY